VAEKLVLIDYGSGNLKSVAKALQRAAQDNAQSIDLIVSGHAADVALADRIVLPGVGAFNHCAQALRNVPDLWESLNRRVIAQATPFLGICVGMQLMAARGLEHGVHQGLGWISGDVIKLAPENPALKIPHMGWNSLKLDGNIHGLATGDQVYFVHSYHVAGCNAVLATTHHGQEIAALVGRDNMLGTQFHPEKSQGIGLNFLSSFLRWKP
jgi:imidazole glycerol-phosphate synthase subunit HisH